MCELLGASFAQPTPISPLFERFRSHGGYDDRPPAHRAWSNNPHGWGMALFGDGAAQIIKEDRRADRSPLAAFVAAGGAPFASALFIAHVRHNPRRPPSLRDTHPFERELFGRSWVLAHNGGLKRIRREPTLRPPAGGYSPIGKTDSEYAFCALLNGLRERLEDFHDPAKPAAIARLAADISQFGCFNFILSDSDSLYCYRSPDGLRSLWWLPLPPVPALPRWPAGEAGPAVVVSTEPLWDAAWRPVAPGALLVLGDGQLREQHQLAA